MSKKYFFSALMTLALVACGENETAAPLAAAQPQKATSAPVAAENDANWPVYKIRSANQPYPPFNIYNANHTISGLDPEILAAIGKDQKIKFDYQPYIWEQIFTNLKENDISMVGGGLIKHDFEAGKEHLVFTNSYVKSPDCVVAKTEADLVDWQKKRIALVEIDEDDDDMVENFGVNRKNIVHVRSQYQGLQFVQDGKVPTTSSDCIVLRYYIKQSFPNAQFAFQELKRAEGDENSSLVFGVRKDQTELLEKLNAGIANIQKSGELDNILKRWQ